MAFHLKLSVKIQGFFMSTNIRLLENLLDYTSTKNKVISKNISNIGTEGYSREDVEFKAILNENLSNQIKTTNSKHFGANNFIQDSEFNVVNDENQEVFSGINNVDIDKEMSELAENSLSFKFASKRIGDYFKIIQEVIKGGSSL